VVKIKYFGRAVVSPWRLENDKMIKLSFYDRHSYFWVFLIGIVSLCYYLSYFNFGINLSDEGYLVYGAKRFLNGQIPGVDFHAYMPGRYILLALLFKTFGLNLLFERSMWVFVRVIIAILYFRLSIKFVSPTIAIIITCLAVLTPGPWHKSFETLFPIAWFLALYAYLMQPKTTKIFFLGLMGGMTLFFRLEIGLVILSLSYVALLFNHVYLSKQTFVLLKLQPNYSYHKINLDIIILLTGNILIFLPYIIFLATRSSVLKGFEFYWHELVMGLTLGDNPFLQPIAPLSKIFSAGESYQLGEWLPLFFYCFVCIHLCAITFSLYLIIKKKADLKIIFYFFLAVYGCILLYQVMSLPDTSHLLQAGPFIYLIAGYLIHRGYQKISGITSDARLKSHFKNIFPLAFVVGCTIILGLYILDVLTGEKDFYYTGSYKIKQTEAIKLGGVRASLLVDPDQKRHINNIVNYLTENSRNNDSLLTMLYIPMFNFLSGLDNPTFYDIYFPHTVGPIENQKKIVEDIRRRKIALIVTTRGVLEAAEGELAERRFRSYGAKIIRYIEDNYHVVKKSGRFLILKINTCKGT
jgi:hypothetical protein